MQRIILVSPTCGARSIDVENSQGIKYVETEHSRDFNLACLILVQDMPIKNNKRTVYKDECQAAMNLIENMDIKIRRSKFLRSFGATIALEEGQSEDEYLFSTEEMKK